MNSRIKIIGADPIGSLYYEKHHYNRVGEAKPYVVEGIGEDVFPSTMNMKILDDVIQVTDKNCFLATRNLARIEGLFAGGSSGAAIWAGLHAAKKLSARDFMVILLPDTGMRYLSKIYNEEWMRENRYLEDETGLRAQDVLDAKARAGKRRALASARPQDSLFGALKVMRDRDISQLPVMEGRKIVGAAFEDDILSLMIKGRDVKKMIVREAMSSPLPVIAPSAPIEAALSLLSAQRPAVLVETRRGVYDIITKYDVLNSVAGLASRGGELKRRLKAGS